MTKGPKKPTLDGVAAKISRARHHYDSFLRGWETFIEDDPYKYSCDIHAKGREHVYSLADPPILDSCFSLMIGDCLHNYRTALDHLACALVELNGRDPTNRTAFPMKPGQRVSGSVSRKSRQIINQVYGLDNGLAPRLLDVLGRLDNIDKHRRLHVVGAIPNNATLAVEYLGPGETTNVDMKASRLFPTLLNKRGQVVAKVVYFSPVTKRDPDFTIEPVLVFGERGSGLPRVINRAPVVSILSRLWSLIEFDMLPMFRPLFA